MRFRLGTLQVVVALSAVPIGLLCQGARAGCLVEVMLVWGVLVAAPLSVMGVGLSRSETEASRDQVVAVFGAIAIVGYILAIPASWAAIDFCSRGSIL
jgi:hypothetical protein